MVVVVYGGSGSGKSEVAEQMAVNLGEERKVYLATMKVYGEEGKKKVERHRKLRYGKGFDTIECHHNLERVDPIMGSCVLLECMSNLVANEMFEPDGTKEEAASKIWRGLERMKGITENLVIVTNNVFDDGCIYGEEMEEYQHILGKLNQNMAAWADLVLEIVFGQVIVQKCRRENMFQSKGKLERLQEVTGLEASLRNENKRDPFFSQKSKEDERNGESDADRSWGEKESNMTVVCGGAFQGKTAYVVENMGISGAEIADGAIFPIEEQEIQRILEIQGSQSREGCKRMRGMNRLHQFIRRAMEAKIDPWSLVVKISDANPDMVWIMDEIGCGLIPVDSFEREYREMAGRIGCELAKRAAQVIRVQMGIGTAIKRSCTE